MDFYRKILFLVVLLFVPVFYVAADTIIPGTIEGEGNYFEITDSEYLNISLESSEPVKIRAESIPEIIMIGLESVSSAKSTEISLSGLAPSTTYYKYQDDFHNLEIFVSDESGNYTYSQNLIESHFIFIQTRKSTKFIKDDPIGGDCASIGDWDVSSKTCTLNIDINQTIQIDNDNVTLDGSGHTLTGTWQIVGVYLYKRTGVTIKNLNIVESSAGIQVRESNNNTFIGNTLDSNSAYGMLFYPSSNNNTVTKNTFSRNRYFGVHVMYSNYNKIYSNNFIGNYIDPYAKTRWQLNFGSAIGNIAYIDPPTGGNYWDDFDTSSEGCNDANNDNFCDAPHVFSGGQDNYPLTKLNGWLEPPSDEPERDPVIIIPGISGTELYKDSDLIWPDVNQMFSDNNDDFLKDLILNEDGQSAIFSVEIGDLIDEITVDILGISIRLLDTFGSLISDLNGVGYDNSSLFPFPYDWRLDIAESRDLLREKIVQVKSQTGSDKVDIIAHSMGGLLAESYLDEYGTNDIGKLIFIGTPHLGAPKAAKVLMEGDRLGIPWLEEDRIQEIVENSPAMYQLLPNQTYFSELSGYIRPSSFLPTSLLDYDQTKNFLLSDKGLNSTIFGFAEEFFAKNLQDLDLSSMEVYNITGCGSQTQSAYSMNIFDAIGRIGYGSGDETVPFGSADYIDIPATNKYYIRKVSHAEMPSSEKIRSALVDILLGNPINTTSDFSNDSSFCGIKGKILNWRSPVDVHIYDTENRHTGPTENNAVEYEIPGIDYEIIGHEKFIFLPTDNGQVYNVEAIGTDEGTFDLLISENENGLILETSVFNDIPVNTDTHVNLLVSELSSHTEIEVKIGDGSPMTIQTDLVLDSEESGDIVPPETQINLMGKEYKDGEYKKEVDISFNAVDDNSDVHETKYSFDGQNFSLYTGIFTLGTEGVYNIYYYSTDRAGNNEEIKSAEIIIGKLSKYLRKIE